MKIGLDGSRAFLKNRTGIEEYSYQVIKHLRDKLEGHQVVLYLRSDQQIDFDLPENWNVKIINFPRLWTQLGLSLEMLFSPADVLFVPAHTVPIIHPKKTVVTIHGLEYEFCPQAYSWWEKFYMRWTIKKSCQWASEIISVSENTKKDLMGLYGVSENKIDVIYEGYEEAENGKLKVESKVRKPYLLFIGRIEERKNISNIIKAFETLKDKYDIGHKLVLAGKPGHNYENIKSQILISEQKENILELGFVSEEEKWELLKNADVFVFPTQYEGFGIPVLEAQSVGCPVVAANNSSIPEVAGDSALLVDAGKPEDIAQSILKLVSDETLKNAIINKGLENVKRFSWDKCAGEISAILKK
jgi:glycosyltransferase involved in cell wall biosynthesis